MAIVEVALLQLLDLIPILDLAGALVLRHMESLAADRADQGEIIDIAAVVEIFRLLLDAVGIGDRAHHQLDAIGELDQRLSGTLQLGAQDVGEHEFRPVSKTPSFSTACSPNEAE